MRKYLLALSLLLAGCGGTYCVRVPYNVPDMPGAAAARPALSAMYLKVVTAPTAEVSGIVALATALGAKQDSELRPAELAKRAAAALRRPGASVCAWRVDKGTADDPFTARLAPAGLLVIRAMPPSISSRKEERSSVYYDKKKQRQTVKNKVWAYSASIYAEVKLYSWPALTELDSWSDTFSFEEDRLNDSKPQDEWYEDNESKLFSPLVTRLVGRYAGRPVGRLRPVFAVKKDAESEEALKLAQHDRWDKAGEIWARRAAAGGWRDLLGLAVAAELRKDYAAAGENYRLAQAAAAGDKDSKAVRWDEIYRDLEIFSATATASGCGAEWFGARTALLPFTDETTSVDGPELVRGLVFENLKAAGYNMVPLAAGDETLRRHGFSDGGQLAASKPAELAKWLDAGRLVYGDVSDFGEIMAGIYNRRTVKGSARVWDAVTGAEQSFEESVVKVKTPKSFAAGMFGQLAKGLAERIKNKPLAYESGLFASQLTENLPNKPR